MNMGWKLLTSRLKTSYVLFDLTKAGWRWALLACLSNLGAALFEGATITLLALALQTLVDPLSAAGTLSFGFAAGFLQPLSSLFGPEKLFLVLVLLAVAAQLSRSLLQFAGSWATAHLQARVQLEGFRRVFHKIMQMPFQRAVSHRLGDLTHLLQETQYLHEFLSQLNLLLRSSLLAATYAFILLSISWPLSLLAFAVYGLISGLLRRVIAKVGRHSASFTEAIQQLHERTTELVQGIRLIHTFNHQEEALKTVQEISRRGMAAERDTTISDRKSVV